MNPIIISLAIDGRDKYEKIQKKLIKTIPPYTDTWILNHYPDGVTPHETMPYLFKFDLIQQAIDLGYTEIMWADSTMRILKNPFTLLKKAKGGVVAFDNSGHPAWKFTTDVAAENLKDYYTNILRVKQTWGGCFLLNIKNPVAKQILAEIINQAYLGSFNHGSSVRDGFVSARHDQTVMSYIFHHYKIPLLPYGIIAAKKDVTKKTVIQYGD